MDVLILVEMDDNEKPTPVSMEMIALAERLSGSVQMVVIHREPEKAASLISEKTGLDVIAVSTPDIDTYHPEAVKGSLQGILSDAKEAIVLVGNTAIGMEIGPGLAIRLGGTCISGVTDFSETADGFSFRRAVYGGAYNEDVTPLTAKTVLMIQPGAFRYTGTPDSATGSIKRFEYKGDSVGYDVTGVLKPESGPAQLSEAKTIIAVGRGLGDPDNLVHAEKFLSFFNNAALGCSRPVVDMGWLQYAHQVGVTGAVVSPELYIACGISGSTQHMAGMAGSDLIVAINNDPNAAIFNYADICIVEEMNDFFYIFEKTIAENG